MMRITLVMSLIVLLFAAACDNSGSQVLPTLASAPTDADNTSEETGAEETPVSDDDASPTLTGNERFTIEISGDMTHTFSGFGNITLLPETTVSNIVFPSSLDLYFAEDLNIMVSISMPDTTTTGIHTLAGFSGRGKFGASLSVTRVPDDFTKGFDDFDNEVQGTITLDQMGSENGDNFSGSFEFTATMIDTDGDGQEVRKTVTVQGTFTDIPLTVA